MLVRFQLLPHSDTYNTIITIGSNPILSSTTRMIGAMVDTLVYKTGYI